MHKDPQIFHPVLEEKDWKRIDVYFTSYTGVDPSNVPEKYGDAVAKTRQYMMDEAKLVCKYCATDVLEKKDTLLTLEEGANFDGKLISKAYADVEGIYLFVNSVVNIDEILERHPDMMENYFIEYWATAMLGVSQVILTVEIDRELKAEGLKLTSVWSPGQSRFLIQNNRDLFKILKPEDMGVTLDKHVRMLPLKTTSGTAGIVPIDRVETMVSCDYCEFRETCPGYKGIKLKDRNVRLGNL